MNWIPLALMIALSLRSPNVPDAPTDYEATLGIKYDPIAVSASYERENGNEYLKYAARGDHPLFTDYMIEYRTDFNEARDIDRQAIIAGRKWTFVGAGVGWTTERYVADEIKGAFDLWLPLPGGRLTWTVAPGHAPMWDAEARYDFTTGKIVPFALGKYFHSGDKEFYQVKLGVEIAFK